MEVRCSIVKYTGLHLRKRNNPCVYRPTPLNNFSLTVQFDFLALDFGPSFSLLSEKEAFNIKSIAIANQGFQSLA